MVGPRKGKLFFLFFLGLILLLSGDFNASSVLAASDSDSVSIRCENEEVSPDGPVTVSHSDRLEASLHKLEEAVRNLTELVARLDASLSETQVSLSSDRKCDVGRFGQPLKDKNEVNDEIEEHGEEHSSEIRRRGKTKAISLTRYSPFWSERFHFASAVKLDSDATCINVLPFRDYDGLSKYFAVGDSSGRVYVFLRNGDHLVEFFTACNSPITAMVSYLSVFKNESFVVTGHQNGEILLHRVHDGSNGDEWNSVVMETVGKFSGREEDGVPVTLLEMHHLGRVRYVLATYLSGKLMVYTENGTVYGSAMPTSRPLVFLKQRLLFLTETGAGSLDLRTMKIKESECEGLNHSLARTYVFDVTEQSKAYGFTSEGEIIHVLLLGDVINFKCRVRSKRKFQIEEPLAFQAIKGYLLIVNEDKVFVYNVSTQHYVRAGGPRLLFSAGLDDIRTSFLNSNQESTKLNQRSKKAIPLIASDRDKLVVIGLGDGYVATYKSKLPIFKGEFNTMLWSSPVFFFILFLFGVWHFFAKKKEALTSWGPDDPFTPTGASTGSQTGGQSSTTNRSFAETSRRSDDIMDLRRRYVSPSRYSSGSGAGAGSYLPGGTSDGNSRAPMEPNYRTAAPELKYRGSALEPSGFGKRRESLFVNSKAMDDEG